MSKKNFDVRYEGLLSMGYEGKDISNRDLDTMLMSGVFYGYNVINAPDINYVQIIITRHSSDWIVQECKDYLDKMYLRSFKNNAWGDWNQLSENQDCDEPDKEIIIVERPHSHPIATTESHGFMSADDKRTLYEYANYVKIHTHPTYESDISKIQKRVDEVETNKSDVHHNHDSRYLTIFSNDQPDDNRVKGHVWIELNE